MESRFSFFWRDIMQNPYKKKYTYKRYFLDVIINIITFGLI